MKRLPAIDNDRLLSVLEGILFVAEEPVAISLLSKTLRRPSNVVESALDALDVDYEGRGIALQRSNGTVQLVSAPAAGLYIERFLGLEGRQRLSTAALECLAIVAYKQPLTRAAVEAVRGVNCDRPIASLMTRGLVEEVGRANGPGRPVLLGTTMKFLEHFGLKKPSDLPPLPVLDGGGESRE